MSAEEGEFLSVHLKPEVRTCTYKQDYETSQLVWEPLMVHYKIKKNLTWKFDTAQFETDFAYWLNFCKEQYLFLLI